MTTTKPTAAQFLSIAKEAAFLTAALLDKTLNEKARLLEVKSSLAELLPQLQTLGFMEAWERDGGFGVSCP